MNLIEFTEDEHGYFHAALNLHIDQGDLTLTAYSRTKKGAALELQGQALAVYEALTLVGVDAENIRQVWMSL
mgnify:CR=1 FL=1